ncbi:hypothetical protein ACVWWN_000662 [Mycobacterium sp. URHB0021]|jgi:hypothetical protein
MNDQPRKPQPHCRWTAEQEVAVRNLADAVQRVREADTPISQEQLRSAVDAARDAGVGWTEKAQAEWDRQRHADRNEQ